MGEVRGGGPASRCRAQKNAMADLVRWKGDLVPRALIEYLRIDEMCPACGGLGEYVEQIDDDRHPEMAPCHVCQQRRERKEANHQ